MEYTTQEFVDALKSIGSYSLGDLIVEVARLREEFSSIQKERDKLRAYADAICEAAYRDIEFANTDDSWDVFTEIKKYREDFPARNRP